MKRSSPRLRAHGPFRADQLRPGDPYELSNGHPVHCLPTGGRGSQVVNVGGSVLASDPAVEKVGVDTGFSPSPDVLRAPDLAVGEIPNEPGWVQGAPHLAVEYADTGQDEADLLIKIQQLFAAGTQYVWIVRLTGPRRVEVYQRGQAMRIARPGEQLTAPGILANPVPVEALYDREAGRQVIFRNLLQREGYASLDAVRAEAESRAELRSLRLAVVDVLTARGFEVGEDLRAALAGSDDPALLKTAHRKAVTAASSAEVLALFQLE